MLRVSATISFNINDSVEGDELITFLTEAVKEKVRTLRFEDKFYKAVLGSLTITDTKGLDI